MKRNICIAIILVTTLSCKRSADSGIPSFRAPLMSSSPSAAPDPGNSANPLDSFGAWHNRLVDSVKAYYQSGGKPNTGTLYLTTLMRDRFGIDISQSLPRISRMMIADSVSGYTSILYTAGVTDRVRKHVLALFQITRDLAGTFEFSKLKLKVTAFEEGILRDRSLPEEEKRIVLIAASIVRHSGWYWLKRDLSVIQQYPEAASGKFFHWLVGAVVDAGSAIGSAIGGGKSGHHVIADAAGASINAVEFMDDPFSKVQEWWMH